MGEVVGGTMRCTGPAAGDELATKSDIVAHTDRLKTRFAALESEMEAFKAAISSAANRVIISQIVIHAVLFAALKSF